jgi:hypothetical protein
MLLLSLIPSLFALFAPSVGATRDIEPHNILSLAPLDVQGNETVLSLQDLPFRPVPTCAQKEEHHNFIVQLFKRAGACETITGTDTYDCDDDSFCCTDASTNWCCSNTAGCGAGGDTFCTTRV